MSQQRAKSDNVWYNPNSMRKVPLGQSTNVYPTYHWNLYSRYDTQQNAA